MSSAVVYRNGIWEFTELPRYDAEPLAVSRALAPDVAGKLEVFKSRILATRPGQADPEIAIINGEFISLR